MGGRGGAPRHGEHAQQKAEFALLVLPVEAGRQLVRHAACGKARVQLCGLTGPLPLCQTAFKHSPIPATGQNAVPRHMRTPLVFAHERLPACAHERQTYRTQAAFPRSVIAGLAVATRRLRLRGLRLSF